MNKAAAAAALIIAATIQAGAETKPVDLGEIAKKVAENIEAKVQQVTAAAQKESAVRALGSPEALATLSSSKLADKVKKLALYQAIAEAAIEDDLKSESGRIKWHGPIVARGVDLDTLTATFTHQDGYVFTVTFSKPNLVEEVKKANARLPKPPMLKGIPAALAAARERRYQEQTNGVQIVNQTINANRAQRPE